MGSRGVQAAVRGEQMVLDHRADRHPVIPLSARGAASHRWRSLRRRSKDHVAESVRRLPIFRTVIVLVLVAAVVLGWGLTRAGAAPYQTALVGTNTVVATLSSVGTITPANEADLNFNVSGTVNAVDVTTGETVTAGQTLATLDTTSLEATVLSDQATLASAKATLANDESGQSSEASSTGGSSSSSNGNSSSTDGSSPSTDELTAEVTGPGSGGTSQQIQALQAAVVAAQQKEDNDATVAALDLKQATATCTASETGTSGGSTTSTTSTTSPASTTTTTGTGTSASACAAALSQTSDAQSLVSSDVQALISAENALTSALEAAVNGASSSGQGSSSSNSGAPISSPGGTSSPPASAGNSSAGKTMPGTTTEPSGNTSSGTASQGTTTHSVTAQQLALDQAAIDTAQADLNDAQQSLADATLVSPIAGTVGSISLSPGEGVSAGGSSSSPSIVIVGPGSSYVVEADVPVSDVGKVSVGKTALITPDATSEVLHGKVTSIGVATTSGTNTVYPVNISFSSGALGQLSGSQAEVSIVTATAKSVITVPSSAVTTVGSLHSVTVLSNGTTKTTAVTLGTVGSEWTQITSGLDKGQTVVLANTKEAVPSSSTTNNSFGGGLGSGSSLGGSSPFGGSGPPSGISLPGGAAA